MTGFDEVGWGVGVEVGFGVTFGVAVGVGLGVAVGLGEGEGVAVAVGVGLLEASGTTKSFWAGELETAMVGTGVGVGEEVLAFWDSPPIEARPPITAIPTTDPMPMSNFLFISL